VTLTAHATVLYVNDVTRALEYYRDRLGFDVQHYDKIPDHYGYASRDNCHLHFACVEGVPPTPNGDLFDVYIYVDDVDALYDELRERGADLMHQPVEQGYGLREIRVRDPHGYVLAFGKLLEQ
jgi:uncharacterized glyoxalase superfamily protein PhnB